ncbi:TIGR04222 domain-containing membrane protein [Streptomyces sp. NPDC006610]|uniref:TIGR04222 domain-containing membrane protein n=1 Tax=Streptomyces sp. NPDC006610 TaxID=3154584 RepID=UPI00339EFE54
MDDGPAIRLRPHEIALLRGGPRAAVTVAVVALHLKGMMVAGPAGFLHPPVSDAVELPPLEAAVHASLEQQPCTLRELAKRPDVRLAVALMRVPLAEAGLLRYPFLGPTRTARLRLRDLRRGLPVPRSGRGLTDHAKLLAVALHGEAGLRAVVPRFALRAGLIRRVEGADRGLLRHTGRNPYSGGGDAGD